MVAWTVDEDAPEREDCFVAAHTLSCTSTCAAALCTSRLAWRDIFKPRACSIKHTALLQNPWDASCTHSDFSLAGQPWGDRAEEPAAVRPAESYRLQLAREMRHMMGACCCWVLQLG